MAQRSELRTVPAGLYSFQVGDVLLWGQLMAAALIATLPVVLLFMLAQRFVVQGLTVQAYRTDKTVKYRETFDNGPGGWFGWISNSAGQKRAADPRRRRAQPQPLVDRL